MTPRSSWTRENTIAVIAIAVSVEGILLSLFNPDVRHFLRLDQSNAANQGSVGSSPNQTLPTALATQTTSEATEIWKGVFHQPGYSAANVELDVHFKNGGDFSGTWMAGNQGSGSYDIGTVSVTGQTALFRSLPGKVQTDLQSSLDQYSLMQTQKLRYNYLAPDVTNVYSSPT